MSLHSLVHVPVHLCQSAQLFTFQLRMLVLEYPPEHKAKYALHVAGALELVVEGSGESEHVLFAAYRGLSGQPFGELFSEFLLDEAVQLWVAFRYS